MDTDSAAEISSRYRRFAELEVRGKSPLYEALAQGVAGDQEVIAFLLTLPYEKRQPNLLLAASRHVFGTAVDWAGFRTKLMANLDAVRAVMLARSTQTNEPARCAVLLPVLAGLRQPLALIEVGASAGLCLLPDHYGFDYGQGLIVPKSATACFPVFNCSAIGTTPLPAALPEVVWRAGLDLHPLDVSDPSQAAWLQTLVWPEQTERLDRLRAAMGVAVAIRPRVVTGSLLSDALERLCYEAPKDATLVVFHTAVLAYVRERDDRAAFAARVTRLCQCWVSNEAAGVFPDIARGLDLDGRKGQFLLSVNGLPVAWTEPHGAAVEWIS